jgi:hypothetical protein
MEPSGRNPWQKNSRETGSKKRKNLAVGCDRSVFWLGSKK